MNEMPLFLRIVVTENNLLKTMLFQDVQQATAAYSGTEDHNPALGENVPEPHHLGLKILVDESILRRDRPCKINFFTHRLIVPPNVPISHLYRGQGHPRSL